MLAQLLVLLPQSSIALSAGPDSGDDLQEDFLASFRRGEDVVAKHAHSEWIAEWYNTWSNLAFCLYALMGMKRCVDKKLGSSFWAAETVMLAGIGFGSAMFHAHQSKAAQCADEIPMSLLLIAQVQCMDGVHPWLTSIKGSPAPLFYWNHGFVAFYWAVYAYTNIYGLFETGFTIQVIVALGLLFDCGRRLNHSQFNWYGAIGFIVLGKVLWEIERKLYNDGACDHPIALSLHPLWHVFAGLSHYCAMRQYAEMLEIARRRKSYGSNGDKKKVE